MDDEVETAEPVAPRPTRTALSELPTRWAVLGPILALAAVYLTLVIFGLTGSSTGQLYAYFAPATDDPQIVMAKPRPIRSDEWYIQSTWVISQVEQNYPRISNSYPGGWDTTVQHDLPVRDWPTIFQPHQWGFFVLPLHQALAIKWWTPSLFMCLAVFAFSILRMPRRPWTSALIGASAFLAPYVQWWFLSITVYPIAWAFTVLAAVTALVNGHRKLGVALAAVAGYLTVTTAIGIYVPFILAAVYPTLAIAVGIGLVAGRSIRLRTVLRRLVPLFIAGAAAGVVTVAWVLTRLSTIEGFLGTSYPGARSAPTGGGSPASLAVLLSAPFHRDVVNSATPTLLAPNESESASFLLIGLAFLLPLVILAVRRWRASREVDWLVVGALVTCVVMLAYEIIPGWDALSRVLLLDKVTPGRLRMGWGVLSLILTVYGLEKLTDRDLTRRWRWILTGATVLSLVVILGLPYIWLVRQSAVLAGTMWIGGLVCVFSLVAVVLACWRAPIVTALMLVLANGLLTWHVNPLYKGYLDIRTLPLGVAIEEIEAKDPGQWIVVGRSVPAIVSVIETGQQGYAGMQGAPSKVMWQEIDPQNQYVYQWNRLGQLTWVLGTGEPMPRNPVPDTIEMTFDPCGRFAQTYVEHVVTQEAVSSACLRLDRQVTEGNAVFLIYRVRPK